MPPNAHYFEQQAARNQLDPFSVLAINPRTTTITLHTIRMQSRLAMKHVFERGPNSAAQTTGYKVPKWMHVNMAKDMLDTDSKIQHAVKVWYHVSVQVWNPMAAPGSPEALVPNTENVSIHSSIPNYGPVRSSTTKTKKAAGSQTAGKKRAFDETASSGPSTPVKQTGTYKSPFVIDGDDDDDDSTQSTPTSASSPYGSMVPFTGSAASSPHVSSSKRRKVPVGMYVGTWIAPGKGLPAVNAVYLSQDTLGRWNRRISKEDYLGNVRSDGGYDPKVTACSHDDIHYIPMFQGLSKTMVEASVKNLMQSSENEVASSATQMLQLGWIDINDLADEDDE